MARAEWGVSGRCSYKRATLIVCCINVVVAAYVLRSLYASLYIYPLGGSHTSKNRVQVLIFMGFFACPFASFDNLEGILVDFRDILLLCKKGSSKF